MPQLTPEQASHQAARLNIVAALLQQMLAELPAILGEGAIESMNPAERAFLTERTAFYKTAIKAVLARGSDPATAPELTREQAGRLYFDAQTAIARITDANGKLRALTAGAIEEAPATNGQKAIWHGKAMDHLAALTTIIDNFPDE